jgi:hypothetical protein
VSPVATDLVAGPGEVGGNTSMTKGITVTTNCRRPGCPRPRACNRTAGETRPYCSLLCSVLNRELDNLERICRSNATNQPAQAAELWTLAVDLSDQLSELFRMKHALRPPREEDPQ